MRSVCYVDFDNVFNLHWKPVHGEFIQHGSKGYSHYSPAVVESFNQFAKTPDLEIIWVTTWESAAGKMGASIGLENSQSWLWLPAMEYDASMDEWLKYDSVRKHWENHSYDSAIWIDDELVDYDFAVEWCSRVGIHAISPNPSTGLTLGDIQTACDLISA